MNWLTWHVHMQFFLFAALGPLVAAASELTPALEACASVLDDEQRLACYDEEIVRLAGLESVPAADNDSPEVSTAGPRHDERQSGSAPEAVENFGMTIELARSMKEKQGGGTAEEPDSIAAVVTRIDEKPHGERIVHLDNDQIWEENSRNRNMPLTVGDEITVKSAAFSSFKLVGPGGKRFTRVKRIR